MSYYNDDLMYHGVKGMHWGVRGKVSSYRNTPDSSGVSRKQVRQEIKKDKRVVKRHLEDFESSTNRSNLIRSARSNKTAAKRKYEDVKSEIKDQKSNGAIGKNVARLALKKLVTSII